MGRFIPLSIPNFEGNEQKYVNDAVAQGWVSTGGAYITKLEESLEQYLGYAWRYGYRSYTYIYCSS